MNDAGLIVIASFISPYREDREMARSIIGRHRFVEVCSSARLWRHACREIRKVFIARRKQGS